MRRLHAGGSGVEQRDIGGGKEVAGETVRPKQDHIASVVARGN
jgi:hypothetical protein